MKPEPCRRHYWVDQPTPCPECGFTCVLVSDKKDETMAL